MGVVQGFSPCVSCRRPFFYNPLKVPSVIVNGTREPVCQTCVDRANPRRIANGLDPIVPMPGAYDACEESEL